MSTNIQANLTLNTAQAQASFNSFAASIGSAKFAQPLGRISGDAAEFTKSLSAATARVTAFGLTAGAIYKVSQAIREGAKATIEVDKQLIELNTYIGKSRDELEAFSQSLFKVAKNSAVPFAAAAEAAKEFARQGLSSNEILKRTGSALTLARIAGISYTQAVTGITTAINSFNKEALSTEDIVNKLIAVDTRFAVSSAQLNEALSRVGSSAEESGISIDKLIATVTAAQQITGRGGAVIGNALKTIFTRLQRPEVLTQLEQLGVAVKDQSGYLLDGISILKNYADATKNLSQTEKARTAELVGGIYQINQVNALIKDLSSSNSIYADALRVSNSATDEAKKKNEELNKSLSAVLQQTKTSAQEAASALGAPLLGPLVKLASTASETLLKLVNPNSDLLGQGEDSGKKFASGILKGAASILGKTLATGGLPILAATGGLLAAKYLKFGVSSLKQLGKATTEMFTSEKELQIQKRINDTLRQHPAIVDNVISRKMNLVQAEAEVLRLIQQQNTSLLIQSRITGRVSSTVTSAQKTAKKGFRIFAEGYIPDTGVAEAAATLEENTARQMGAVNPKARVIQATIKGQTGPIIVNDQETVIPNYANGETAIIPNYRKLDEIPRMAKGYVPNFAWSKSNQMPKDFLIKYPESKAAIKAGRMYSPEVRAMLGKLQTGEKIDRDLLDSLIERDIPIREVAPPSSVKDLPSKALIKNALDKEQAKRASKLSELPAGSEITVRQDVPSMTRKGVGVVKTESSGGFKSYDSFVAFDNPVMSKSPGLEKASLAIGAGKQKTPLLKISGALSKDQSLPKDLEKWTQVGFNPDRHSYYYDRKTKKPVVGGQQAIQIGNTVFVKEAIHGNREDFSYAKGYVPNFAKGIHINDKTQDFTGEILKKEKVIETRDSVKSLNPYVGKRVGLIRTGVGDATLVGYAKIGNPIKYKTAEQFRADYPKHKVKEGSKYDFANSKYGVKYGFPLSEVTPTKNIKITSRGSYVARDIPDFASGYIPNFAKRLDVIERIGKEEIFARFQKHFEKGKDYQGFYKIHAEEYTKKGLSEEERRMHANITSAISPRLADYIAAQFSGPIFNRFMETRSTNVDDYLDLPPAKKVSDHETLGGTGDMGRKGEIARSGKIRDRDDVRRAGLSKALKGLDLGSHDTAKTRHYARAILQDKTAFPIDTNVIQAILGGKTPTPNEAAKLISLANEFATLNKIETGASGLQAAIFKSNSKFAEQYSPDTVRSALSGIKGRAGGYVPNFANINAEKLILGGRGNNLLLTSPYDSLKTNLDPSSQVSGGIGYGLKFPDRSYASTARSSGVDAMQALHDSAKKQGGRAYFAPHVPAGAISKYGADDGGMNMRNIFFLQQLVSKNQKDFPRSFVSSVLSINPANASLKGTGSLYDEARNHLRRRGFSSKAIGKKFREGASGLHDEMVEKYADAGKNKYSISGIVSRVSDVGGSVIAPSSGHALYPKSTYADAQFSSAQGIDITHEIEKLTGVKVTGTTKQKYSPSGKPMNRPDPAGTSYQPVSSFLPYGVRFDTGDPISQMFGGLAEGYVPNFALGQKHLNPDGKRHSRKLARSSEEVSAMSKAFKSLNLERKNNKISIFKSEYSHWSGKNQSIGLEKPYRGLSSRAKQIEILAAYAHEMGHSSQLSGLERLRGAHSEIFNKHYSNAGIGEGYDREFELLKEQDAWKEGLRFIPRQFQSAYKTQANRFYKTYSPDGKPMFDAFGAPGYASGYVPNFAEGSGSLSKLSFLAKNAGKFSTLISPVQVAKLMMGKASITDVFRPLVPLMKEPTKYIKSSSDLQAAKSILSTLYSNDILRDQGAKFLSSIIEETNFNSRSTSARAETAVEIGKTDSNTDYLKYRLFGGKKNLKQFNKEQVKGKGLDEPELLAENRDGTYRFRESHPRGKSEIAEVIESAKTLFTENRTFDPSEKILEPKGKGGKFLGVSFKMGRYIGDLGRSRKAVRYQDTWDVDLHQNEIELLDGYLSGKQSKDQVDKTLGDLHYSQNYSGDTNSLILRDLVSTISNPLTLKGIARIPKDKRFSEGYIPNFAKLSVYHGTNDPDFARKIKLTGLRGLKKEIRGRSSSGTSFTDNKDMYDINSRGLFTSADKSTAQKYGKHVFETQVDEDEFYNYDNLSKTKLGVNPFYNDFGRNYNKRIKNMTGGFFHDTEKAEGNERRLPGGGFPNAAVTKNFVISRNIKSLDWNKALASGYVPNFAKKIIGYHATGSQNFGKQINPSQSFGEGQGQGFYFWKNKELAENHSKFLKSAYEPFSDQRPHKIIAGRFDRQHVVPDYETHTKEAAAFLKENQDLLSNLQSGRASYIDREGEVIGSLQSVKVNPGSNTFTVKMVTKSGIKRTNSLSFDSQEGTIGSGSVLGPLFDALRSQYPERVRPFEENLIDKGGKAFRYMGPETKAFSRNLASGYIPNFSGLSDAVSREKTMSGLPASQIMAHFDRGGNPVAVTNKRDEPNGLKDVPNFALPSRQLVSILSKLGLLKGRNNLANPISAGVESFQGTFATSILDQLAESELISSKVSTAANVAVPSIYGLRNIGKGIFGKGSKLQKGIAIASGTAQLGVGVVSAFQGGSDLNNRINIKKYEEALDRSKKTFQNLTENTLELSNTLSKLDEAYRDPKADPKQILKLASTMQDLLSKVKTSNPGLVSKLASESSLAGQQAILDENTKESQRVLSLTTEALKFSSKGPILGKDAPKELDSFFKSIINSGNKDLLKQDLSKAGPENFSEILSKGGLNIQELSNVFRTDDLKKSFLDAIKLTQALNEITSGQERAIIDVSKPLTRKKQEAEDSRAVRASISKALEDQLPELASFAGGFSKRAGISASSDASLAIQTTQSSVSFQNSLLTQLSDKEFAKGLPSEVQAKLNAIETPSAATGRDLESIKQLPGLSKAQVAGIEKLIGFNAQQTREIQKAGTIANETKNIQLKFLALQEKLAFGGDIKTSINPQMRAESMSAGLRGPLTYQLGTLFGSRRTQLGGATDFLTETMQKYPGLLQTKGGKEPGDISAVKRELTGLNAMDMQKDLLKRSNMAQMMGLGQTSGLLRNKAFDSKYLFESAGLKADALFGSPEVPEEVKRSMQDYEKFGVQSAKQAKVDDSALRQVEDLLSPIKQQITEQAAATMQGLVSGFEASLKSTFGDKGIAADVVKLYGAAVRDKTSEAGPAQAPNNTEGGPPPGVPSSANRLTKYSGSIADAVNRERTALASRGIMGVPNFAMAGINLERSPDLVNASNPHGFGVTNSIDEKNGLRSLGMRSSGYVPNFAGLKDVQKVAEGIKDVAKGYSDIEKDDDSKGAASVVKGVSGLIAPISEAFKLIKKQAPILSAIDPLMQAGQLSSEGNYVGGVAKAIEGVATVASTLEKTSSGFQMGLKATGSANVASLAQSGGKLSGAASAAGLIAEIATSKNNAIAEDWSDIIFGKKTDGKRDALGAGVNAASLGLTAASGRFGLGVATATLGYRTGNVIENKLGLGDKLGEAYAGGAASAIARNADKATVGLSSKEASASGLAEMRKAQLMQQSDMLNKTAGYPEVNRFAILARNKNAEDRKRESQNLIAGSAGAFIPNYAKSRMEELLERIYPRADAPKPVIPSDPAPILGVSQKTMPFYPERIVNETYPFGNRPSMGNVNPTVKPGVTLSAQDPSTGKFLSKSEADLRQRIEQGQSAKAAKKAQLAQGSPAGFSSYLKKPGLQQMLALAPEEQARIRRGVFESSQRAGAAQTAAYQKSFLAQKASEFQPGAQSGGLRMLPRGQSSEPLFSGKNKTQTSPLGLLPKGQVTFTGQAYVPTGPAADRVRELQGETRTRIGSPSLKMQSERVIPSLKLKNPYLEAFLARDEKESRRILEKAIRENFKLAQQQERQAAANRYFEKTAPQRAEMKAFSEAQQARLAKEAADKIRSGQKIDLSNVIRGHGTTPFSKGRSADLRDVISKLSFSSKDNVASNIKEYTPEEVNKILSRKQATPSPGAAPSSPVSAMRPPGSPSPATSGILNKLKGAGKFGLKGLGVAGSIGFGIGQGLESYSSAKEGNYGQATLSGLASATGFAGLIKGAGKVVGPAGVVLGGLGDLKSDLTLAEDWSDIFGRRKRTYSIGPDGKTKEDVESIDPADVIGTGINALVSAPATVALLGYRTGNILENKLGLGEKLGNFTSGVFSGGKSLVRLQESGRSIRGMPSKEAYDSDQIKTRKMELVKEVNKYNRAAGNPEISFEDNLAKAKKTQEKKDKLDTEALIENIGKESQATRSGITSRAAGIGAAETARLNKESSEREEARSSKLRKSFLESFDKNAEANGYTTTRDKANYLLGQEGQNGLGSFKPTDFKDPGFAKSFDIYKTAKEKEAAREANRVIPKSVIEFGDRPPQQSFPDDVLREAVRTARSAETVMQDREDEKIKRGLMPPLPPGSPIEIRNRPDPFTRDVLLEAARRRVPAEKIIQEREAAKKDPLPLLPPALMGQIAIAGESGSLIPGPLPSKRQGSEGFDPNKPDSYPVDVVAEAIRTGRKPEQVIKNREQGIQATDVPGGYSRGIIEEAMNRRGLGPEQGEAGETGLQSFPKDVLEEAMRRRVPAEQVMQERAGGKVPNFAAMSNNMMSSGDVYSRMRSSAPRNFAPSYAQGSVPNFAAGDFTNAVTEALKTGITSAFPGGGGSSSNVSNSNVINIDGRSSIQNAPDEAMQGIISILFDKIPELKKLGPAALNFKK